MDKFRLFMRYTHSIFLCVCVLVFFLYASLYEGIRSPGIGVTDSGELPCGCWELSPGPLEEQPVLLTTEPSLQCPCLSFLYQCSSGQKMVRSESQSGSHRAEGKGIFPCSALFISRCLVV